MPEVLRLLWIAESDADAASIADALQTRIAVQRISSASAGPVPAADVDLAICSYDGARTPAGLAAFVAVPREQRPPLILIADNYDAVAREAFRYAAMVCLRGQLSLQLPAAVESALQDAGASLEQRRKQTFELGQREVLEQIAAGESRAKLLEAIVRLIEQQSDDMLCSILLLDRDRRVVRHGAVSLLPHAFIEAIDGRPIGPTAGSCGTAAYRGERVIVEDIATHPYWVEYRDYALQFGLRACWSSPIFSPAREVLGTFAMYYRVPRGPTPREMFWVGRATHLASIVLVRDRDERALRQTQRMESLGTLAGGIAHDFNNILTAITGNVRLTSGDLAPDHPAQESLREIQNASERAADLVQQILTFSRSSEGKREVVRLETITDEALRLLSPTLPAEVRIETHYASDLPDLLAHPTELHRIVMNLATNAVHAMRERGGVLTVRIEREEARARWYAGTTQLREGVYLKLEVCDTGSGIASEALDRIFDPFFTTKELGQGAGLGLSVVHGIVKSHDGAIQVHSELGRGSSFCVYLPALPHAEAKERRTGRAAPVRGEGERVLCLDDEEPVVRVTTQMLRRIGYRAVGHVDPLLALHEFQAQPEAVDVVLTDFAMPQLGCLELVAAIRKHRPELPIVVTSGRIDAADVAALRAQGVTEVVHKPSTLEELSGALRRALRGQR